MIELSDKDISVYECNFNIHIQSANISIKFPCHYFIEWKSINGKVLAFSSKYPSLNNSFVQFNESLSINTQMLYDNKENHFYKKQTILMINLVSKSRPDQVKLVGRLNIDLADMANSNSSMYSQYGTYKLTYCSVNADVTFLAKLTNKQLTNKQPNSLDKSSFNDFFAFNTAAGTPLQNIRSLQTVRSYEKLNSNIQNTTFPIMKSKQQKYNQYIKKQISPQQKIIQDIQTVNNFVTIPSNTKNEDSSFRTVPAKKQFTFKSTTNDSYQNNNLWNFKQDKFNEQIDVNKRKILDLQKKISQLCRSLQQSKNQMQKKDSQNRQKQQMIMRLKQNEARIRQQYQFANRQMKNSDSFDLKMEEQEIKQFFQNQKGNNKHQKGIDRNHSPTSTNLYNQKLSHALQTQRLLQQNQYMIRELQNNKNQLQKKLLNQKMQFQQLHNIWKQKNLYLQQKIKNLQKQKRNIQLQNESLIKFKFKVQQSAEQKNKIKQEYKQLQHQLMKIRFQLNDKIQRHAQTVQRLQNKQLQNQKSKIQLKELHLQRTNIQRQLTQSIIQNQRFRQTITRKQNQSESLYQKIKQLEGKLYTTSLQLNQNKKVQEQKRKMQQKLQMYNNYMETLNKTIENLQKQIQACQYISRINQNLKIQISKTDAIIKEKDQIIVEKNLSIQKKDDQITLIQNKLQTAKQQKQYLLQKNQSFQKQIQKIQQILQQSFHKKDAQNQQVISKLKQQIRVSNQQYQQILKQKRELQDEIQHLIQVKQEQVGQLQRQLQNSQYRVQDLLKTITDKLNIITMKDIQLQNRKLINQQLTRKLQKMEQKQNQMQQTIAILQEQSKKIFDIIQQKQFIDQQLLALRRNAQQSINVIQQLQDSMLQLKLQKQQISRKYLQEIQNNQEIKQNIKQQQKIIQNYADQLNQQRAKQEEFQAIVQQQNQKIQSLIDEIKQKCILLQNLQQKHDHLLKNYYKLQSYIKNNKNQNISHNIQTGQTGLSPQINYQAIMQQKEQELHQQININKKNLIRFKNQILQLQSQKKTLSQKVIELQNMLNSHQNKRVQDNAINYVSFQKNIYQDALSNDKSQQLTPIKNNLNDQLYNKLNDNQYILSDRKNPISNRSGQSIGSLQFVQNPIICASSNNKQFLNDSIPQLRFRQNYNGNCHEQLVYEQNKLFNPDYNQKIQSKPRIKRINTSQLEEFNNNQLSHPIIDTEEDPQIITNGYRHQTIHKEQKKVSQKIHLRQLNFQKIGVNFSKQEKEDPQLKIQKLYSIIELKNIIIKDLQIRQNQLKAHVSQSQQNLIKLQNNQNLILSNSAQNFQSPKGKIRSNTPKKSQEPQINRQNSIKRSDSSKIIKNINFQQKQEQKLKLTLQKKSQQIKRLKKNIRLMNLQLVTLKNLKKQRIIGGIQIKLNRSHCHSQTHSNYNDFSQTNYLNLTNAVNPNQKSYIIRRNLNEEESMYDKKSSPKKQTKYGKVISNRQFLQKRFNINSRVFPGNNLFKQNQSNIHKANKQNSKVQRKILQKLQNTPNFTLLNDQQNQFITTINDLKSKISQLQDALYIIEQQKRFLQDQIQMFEQQKFCLSSDLNSRQIQIYQLYKSIVALRQQISMLKYQNQAYLRMIQQHQTNVNSIVRRVQQKHSQIYVPQNQKIHSFQMSKIQYQNEQFRSQISSDILLKQNHVNNRRLQQAIKDQEMYQKRNQERLSIIQKIQKYQKKIQQSIILEKQKQILQEQIQSKEQILIDQNQKLFEQENQIKNLHEQVNHLQNQIKKLTQLTNKPQQNQILKSQNNDSIIIYQNSSLKKQNQNLKQEIQFLSNQIDRMNQQFNLLNNLLYKRQQQITMQKKQIENFNKKQIQMKQHYLSNIRNMENQIVQMESIMMNVQKNRPHEQFKIISFVFQKLHDLYEQFQNLNSNINVIVVQKQQKATQQERQFIMALLESMQNNIIQVIQSLKQILQSFKRNRQQTEWQRSPISLSP